MKMTQSDAIAYAICTYIAIVAVYNVIISVI